MGQSFQKGSFTYAVSNKHQTEKPEGYSKELINYLNKDSPDHFSDQQYEGYPTVWEIVQRSLKRIPNHRFLGTRNLTVLPHQPYEWKTFRETIDVSEQILKGIHAFNLSQTQVIDNEQWKLMGIYAENREEWVITELACISDSVTIVPIYINQHLNCVEDIVNQAELQTICVSSLTIDTIINLKEQGKLKSLIKIINFDNFTETQNQKVQSFNLEAYTYKSLLQTGSKISQVRRQEPTSDSILLISYTSGTTGDCKGSMITHKNMMSGISKTDFLGVDFNEKDTYLSYVPLSHIMEQLMLAMSIQFGYSIGFSSGKVEELIKDIQALKPTIFGSFPVFYSKLYKRVVSKIESESRITKAVFQKVLREKTARYQETGKLTHPVYDKLFFKSIRDALGGNLRWIVSGGAPLSQDIMNFLRASFSCPVLEAYGSTETSGFVCCTQRDEKQAGIVGGPLPSHKIKFKDLEEYGFLTTDDPPRGEVCIKGNSVFKGYFRKPELTKKVLDEHGWLHLGDVATILTNGSLYLIDRVSQICKLQNGQFVAPQYLENLFLQIKYINQIFICADSKYKAVAAIIVPDQDLITHKAVEFGLLHKDDQLPYEEILKKSEIIEFLKELLSSKEEEFKLLKHERASDRFYISHNAFSIENGIMNQSMKLKRHEAYLHYKDVIAELFIKESEI